ncbi:MAG: ABC transporter substrate-binding protein [Bacteroidota bacterium]
MLKLMLQSHVSSRNYVTGLKQFVRSMTAISLFQTNCLFILLFICLYQSGFAQEKLRKVRFVAHWKAQAQFAGYYMAHDLGIYRKYGIDLEIVPGGPDNPSTVLLENGKVDFASLWLTNAVQLREKGVKIVNITQLINHSALMLIAKKSSGIKSIQDMQGKKVGIWGGDFSIQPLSFFKKYNIQVTTVPLGASVNLFLMDGVDVTSAMWYNEYHTIVNSGLNENELVSFFLSDHGLNFPEEGIYCSEELFRRDRQLCRDFVRATLEGWQMAFKQPERAIKCVMSYIKAGKYMASRSHEKWMLLRMKDLIFPGAIKEKFEILSEKDYMLVCQKLKEYGLIDNIPRFKEFYKAGELDR